MNARSKQMTDWLDSLGYRDYSLSPASEDASFRSYHRLCCRSQSWIVMDAPPDKEPCDSFIAVSAKLRAADLSAPEVIEQNLAQGFLLLTDLGDTSYLSALADDSERALYDDALAALLQMQQRVDSSDIPAYGETLLLTEMDLFHEWFLEQFLGIELSPSQQAAWMTLRQTLLDNALEQPQVFVHRDYHSRNLMRLEQGNPGVLDFQDAVKGPVTYDLVSLLRDCYISWPVARVEQLTLSYYESAKEGGLIDVRPNQFLRWFNLMGVQRQLKAIGIFSRLKIRDGKGGYVNDIPRTLEYLHQVADAEKAMAGLHQLLSELDIRQRVRELL